MSNTEPSEQTRIRGDILRVAGWRDRLPNYLLPENNRWNTLFEWRRR